MFSIGPFRSKILAWGLVAAFLVLTVPLSSAAQTQAKSYARQGTLQGTVYSEGQKARVSNAVVKIRNLNTQKEYASQPTDAKGNYKILMIEEGWYTLGVSTPAGDFNLNYGVYIKAGETAKLSVEMLPGGMLEGKGGNAGAGGKSFFATPGGVLVIVALVGGAAFGVYELTKTEEVSPIR
jgi:Carboxypeptidase regulatory-like domain